MFSVCHHTHTRPQPAANNHNNDAINRTDTTAKRETGREAQLGNIAAAKTLADVIRTCLGPKSMLKMVLDAMGGVALTNDGNAILRVCTTEPHRKQQQQHTRTLLTRTHTTGD